MKQSYHGKKKEKKTDIKRCKSYDNLKIIIETNFIYYIVIIRLLNEIEK